MTEHKKIVAIGDLQLPWTDYRALTLWFDMMKWWKPTDVVFVGDIDDQLEYSSFSDGTTDEFFNVMKKKQAESNKEHEKWEKALEAYDPESDTILPPKPEKFESNALPFVKENAEDARKFYTAVRAQHKRSKMFSCLGNHDIRVFKYLDKKAPDIIDEVTPNFLYDFDKLGIDYMMYSEKPKELFPKVFFHHGVTTSSSGAAVRADVDNYGVSLVRGHDHAGAVIYKTSPLANQSLFGLACGHMCDPNLYGLQYTINPAWELGFGILHIYGDQVHPQFINIKSDYTAVLDGKHFAG
jgi:hypothetical protein